MWGVGCRAHLVRRVRTTPCANSRPGAGIGIGRSSGPPTRTHTYTHIIVTRITVSEAVDPEVSLLQVEGFECNAYGRV